MKYPVSVYLFGGEGTGGQSFYDYDWKIGESVRFVVFARPDGPDRTQYAAYIYLPNESRWQHMATFSTLAGGRLLRGYYSFVEDFLRNGDLLPGPNKHRWSKDQPAYEFPTGDPDTRVVARRHRHRDEWLMTAWAAGGEDRNVTVDIPDLGRVTLLARDCGSVYRASVEDGKPSAKLLDRDGMMPTGGFTDRAPRVF